MDAVFLPEGVRALDADLERAGLLDPAMEEAGRAAAEAVQGRFGCGRVLVLAGAGANGGDALVAARHLHALGREVRVLAQSAGHPLTRLNRKRLRAFGVPVAPLSAAALRRELPGAAVVVDGLLGTGFRPPLRPALAEVVALLNAAACPVVSLDLPSGLNAALAEAPEGDRAVRADLTITFAGPKPALLFGPAAHWAGEVQVAPLSVPAEWRLAHAVATRPTHSEVAALLPVRFADAHKGTAGRVWVVGGAPGTLGAAALAGLAALRAGAGLVTVYSEGEVPLLTPELMMQTGPDLPGRLARAAPRPDALCVGMGLGTAAARVARLVLGWQIRIVLDADALHPELAGLGHPDCIWTPHPGEAARLLGVGTPDITRDPLAAARALQVRLGGVVVLKGGPSVIASAQGLYLSRGGHPGMASAGMGDTLSGILAALLAQGLSAPHAALAGVTLHARAGELAAQQYGYGLSASDVSAELGRAWASLAP